MVPIPGRSENSPARQEIHTRVLVIDNEPLVCWALANGLRLAGFDALESSDAAIALELARLLPPDIIMLDTQLWGTNPTELLEALHRVAPRCQFLVLAVAGGNSDLPHWDSLQVIRKPFDLDEVVRVVSRTAGHAETRPAQRIEHGGGV